jgi:hypothetical protein
MALMLLSRGWGYFHCQTLFRRRCRLIVFYFWSCLGLNPHRWRHWSGHRLRLFHLRGFFYLRDRLSLCYLSEFVTVRVVRRGCGLVVLVKLLDIVPLAVIAHDANDFLVVMVDTIAGPSPCRLTGDLLYPGLLEARTPRDLHRKDFLAVLLVELGSNSYFIVFVARVRQTGNFDYGVGLKLSRMGRRGLILPWEILLSSTPALPTLRV